MLLRRQILGLLTALALPAAEKPTPPAAALRCRVTAWMGDPPLPAASLKAVVDGRDAKIAGLRDPASPLLLHVVLDLTGDLALISPAREALKSALQELPDNVWVSLLRAQDGLRVLADPAPVRAAAIAQLDALDTTGRAGLLETIEPAEALAERILRRSPVRTAIFFLTDSNIYNYREDYTNPVINPSDSRDLSRRFPEALIREKASKLAAVLNVFDVPVFIQHLAWLRDRLNSAYQTSLQQIAEATGGSAAFSRAPGDIPGDIGQMIKKITSLWAVDLELPAGTPSIYTVQLSAAGRDIQYRTRFTLPPRRKEPKS